MRLPDGTILMHGTQPYDPRKAHEYYLRTRHLKGRKKGQTEIQGDFGGGRKQTFTVKTANGKTVTLTAQQLEEQKAYAAQRVAKITSRLHDLGLKLKAKLEAAKKAEAKAHHKPTRAEQAKAARDAKKYRESHKQSLKNKRKVATSKQPVRPKPKTDTVAELEQTIIKVKANLTAAVAKQRQLAAATKNS